VKKILLIILVIGSVLPPALQSQPTGYERRMLLSVDNTQVSGSTALVDFPVLVKVGHNDLRSTSNGGEMQNPSGFDIAFTASDGSTLLDFEIETYDAATGTTGVWVRVPSLSATVDTDIYLYFNQSGIYTDPSVNTTWPGHYKGVFHFNGNVLDASPFGNDFTDYSTSSVVSGVIAGAREFTGNGDYLLDDDAESYLFGQPSLSFTMWLKADQVGTDKGVFFGDIPSGSDTRLGLRYDAAGGHGGTNLYYAINRLTTGNAPYESSSNVHSTDWQHIAVTHTGGNAIKMYIDGQLDTPVFIRTKSGVTKDITQFVLGQGAYDGTTSSWDGLIDEFRVDTTELSIDWIATEYNNQNTPGVFLSITPTADLPILQNMETVSQTFATGGGAVDVTASVAVFDYDNASMASADVQIAGNYTSPEDTLIFTSSSGIIGSWTEGSGALTLTGVTTKANWETVLHSVQYNNNNSSANEATRTVSISINDGTNTSAIVTRDIVMNAVNQVPVLANLEGATLAYNDGDSEVAISGTITISDADNAYLENATIQITGNYQDGEDRLGFTNTAGIYGSWSTVSGALTLTGVSSTSDYQSALRSVTYENISHDPNEATRTVSFTVDDGSDPSNTLTRNISVAKVNDAPVFSDIEIEDILYSPIDGQVIVSHTVELIDYDDTIIDSAQVRISQNYIIEEDSLVYPGGYGITATWNNANGVLGLVGSVPVADYQSALRSVTYEAVVENPSGVTRTITFFATDGELISSGISRGVASSIPGTISDLEVWVKADAGTYSDAGSTPSVPDGGVSIWADLSGNTRNFDANNPNPLLRTNVTTLNGADALEFGGSNRFTDGDGELYLEGMTELTIFFVLQSSVTNTDNGFLVTKNPIGTDRIFSLRYMATGSLGGGTNGLKAGLVNSDELNILESSSDKQTTEPQIVCLDWKNGQDYDLYLDGVFDGPTYQGSQAPGSITGSTFLEFGRGVSGGWVGLIAEVIFYGRHLTESERLKIEDYLSTRYDIPVRLIGPATGGEEISADDANITYTTLSGPRIREDYIGELTAAGTLILDVPAGFEWDLEGIAPSITVQPAFGTSTTLAVSFTSRTSSQVIFTINTASDASAKPGELTISDLRVKPTTGTVPNSGYLTNSGLTGPSTSVNLGTLSMVAGTPSKMVYIQEPSTATIDEVITPDIIVEIQDQNNNAVEEYGTSVTLSLSSGTGILSGTNNKITDIYGRVNFDDISIDLVGLKVLTTSSAGITNAVSSAFNAYVPGAFTTFLIERPSGGDILTQTAAQTFAIKISAVDGTNAVDVTFTGTVDITSTGTLSAGGGTTANFTEGVLNSHSLTITNIGQFTVTATNTIGSEYAISNSFTVESGPASAATSQVTANPMIIINNGTSISSITVQLYDAGNNALTSGGDVVNMLTTAGSFTGPVTDNNDGTYTQIQQSSITAQTAIITAVVNGNTIVDNAEVTFSAITAQWESDPGSDAYTTDWNDVRNWDTGTIPNTSDVVFIPANPTDGTKQPIVSANTSVGGVVVESEADITLQDGISLIVTGDVIGDGDINGSITDSLLIEGDVDIGSISLTNVSFSGSAIQSIIYPLSYTNLEIESGTEVTPVNNLTIAGTLTLTAGTLVIPSGKSLIANTKIITAGTLKYERELMGETGWRLLASPIISTYGDFLDSIFTQGYTGSDSVTGSPSVLWYDETFTGTDNQRWRDPSNITDSTVPGRGLFVYVFGDITGEAIYSNPLPVILDVSGTETEGDGSAFDFGVTYTATGDTGWNLIGNPFGATIDWDSPNWTRTNIEQTIYVWDNSANSGQGDYLLWNGLTGSLGSGLIPPFQGFWIKANATGPVLKVNKSGKTVGGVFYKKLNEEVKRITLALEVDTLLTTAFIMFHPESHINHDTYDGYRLIPPVDTYLELGIVRDDGILMTIESIPDKFGVPVQLPLEVGGFDADDAITGTFELSWYHMNSLHKEWTVTLMDHETSQSIDMLENQFYSFNVNNGNPRLRSSFKNKLEQAAITPRPRRLGRSSKLSRFSVVIDPGIAFPELPREYSVGSNYPNPFNPTTTIQFNLPLESLVGIKIYNILGREVAEFEPQRYRAGSHKIRWNASTISSGIYFAQIQINEKLYTQKMTVIK